jgi:hypothetical protein
LPGPPKPEIPLKLTDPRLPGQAGVRVLGAPLRTTRPGFHLSELLIAVNLVLSFPPRPFTAAMMASEMPAAIRPYSMAVAAVSSFKNLEMIVTLGTAPVVLSKQTILDRTNVRASLAALVPWITPTCYGSANSQG